jgi:hypothetical protein
MIGLLAAILVIGLSIQQQRSDGLKNLVLPLTVNLRKRTVHSRITTGLETVLPIQGSRQYFSCKTFVVNRLDETR